MEAHPSRSKSCPLGAVHRRLEDVHRLWHQAEAAYFDPDGFRLNVQNAIHTLRSVTWILQSHKAAIPNFDQWYGNYVKEKQGKRGRWQKILHADPLMRWVVEARNQIEKQSDLEIHSFVQAEILASHLDEGPRTEIPAHLFQSVKELLHSIPDCPVGEHIRRHGVLRIQRRWVANSLVNYELLDAVAVAYGRIAELIHDAHRQIGLDPPDTIYGDAGERYDGPAMGWRMPCMIGHEFLRAMSFSLADGTQLTFESKPIDMDAARTTALDRYGTELFEQFTGREYKTVEDRARVFFELARAMFLRDGYHDQILFLLRDRKPIGTFTVHIENRQQSYLLMRQLSTEITKSGADAAFLISEVWSASPASLKLYERPADSSARKEALTLTLVSKTEKPLQLRAMIFRDANGVSLGETEINDRVVPFQFVSFYQAWGRPIPSSWAKSGRAASDSA
jgi:hypothetical protein